MAKNSFESTARQRQETWRKEHGYDPGEHPGWLKMPMAECEGWNFLTPGIQAVVKAEFERNRHVKDERSKKLFGHPRLFNNMLSSQPMCFNLFGELALDTSLATSAFHELLRDRVVRVHEVRFEYSPGRRDPRYLNNRSAADAFVVHTTPNGGLGFIAIETKYVENMTASPGTWDQGRYGAIAQANSDVWIKGKPPTTGKLLQVTLDHLLALSMLTASDGWETGLFSFVYPSQNDACAQAASDYNDCLTDAGKKTFRAITIEEVVTAIAHATRAKWVHDFRRRYFGKSTLPTGS